MNQEQLDLANQRTKAKKQFKQQYGYKPSNDELLAFMQPQQQVNNDPGIPIQIHEPVYNQPPGLNINLNLNQSQRDKQILLNYYLSNNEWPLDKLPATVIPNNEYKHLIAPTDHKFKPFMYVDHLNDYKLSNNASEITIANGQYEVWLINQSEFRDLLPHEENFMDRRKHIAKRYDPNTFPQRLAHYQSKYPLEHQWYEKGFKVSKNTYFSWYKMDDRFKAQHLLGLDREQNYVEDKIFDKFESNQFTVRDAIEYLKYGTHSRRKYTLNPEVNNSKKVVTDTKPKEQLQDDTVHITEIVK